MAGDELRAERLELQVRTRIWTWGDVHCTYNVYVLIGSSAPFQREIQRLRMENTHLHTKITDLSTAYQVIIYL